MFGPASTAAAAERDDQRSGTSVLRSRDTFLLNTTRNSGRIFLYLVVKAFGLVHVKTKSKVINRIIDANTDMVVRQGTRETDVQIHRHETNICTDDTGTNTV